MHGFIYLHVDAGCGVVSYISDAGLVFSCIHSITVCVCEPLLGVIQLVTERLLTELSALIKDSSAVAAEWRERGRESYLIHLGALVLPSWTGADLTLTSSAVEATTPSTSEPQDPNIWTGATRLTDYH